VQVSGLCKPELNRVYYLVGVLGSYGHWQSRNGHNLYFSQRCCGPRWFIDSDLEDSHSEASLPLRAAPSVGAATVPASGSNWQVYCGELAAMIDSVHVNILPAARQHEARESGGGGGVGGGPGLFGGGCRRRLSRMCEADRLIAPHRCPRCPGRPRGGREVDVSARHR
jgi:hypothetical protein